MKRLLIVLIFIGQVLTSYSFCSADSTKEARLRIKNSSKYHIIKVTILEHTIDNLKPGQKSDYFLVKPFYPSFKVDNTFVKKGHVKTAPWEHVITYPIDYVGDKLIDNKNNTVVIEISESETLGQFEIDTRLKKK